MSHSIEGSFRQWFANKTTKKQEENHQSEDSDSDEEQRRKEHSKLIRKEKKRSKLPKPKRSAFETIPKPKHVEIDADKIEILDIDGALEEEEPTPDELLSQAQYFNGMNRNGQQPVSPYLYPWIKHRLTTKEKIVHKEDVVAKLRANVEVVCRAHEEKYLCEPDMALGERSCSRGTECEGLKIHEAGDNAFVLKEYYTPNEEKAKAAGKEEDPKLCLMCLRFLIHQCVLEIKADGEYLHDDMIMQSFGNIVGLPGEYTIDSIVCSDKETYEGLVLPIVEHRRTAYTIEVREVNGKQIRYYIQSNMAYPTPTQHFQ